MVGLEREGVRRGRDAPAVLGRFALTSCLYSSVSFLYEQHALYLMVLALDRSAVRERRLKVGRKRRDASTLARVP